MALRVETPRLIIRNWTEDDIDPYAEMVSDPIVMRFIGNGQPRDRAYAEEFVRRMIQVHEERGWIRFAVEHRESGAFLGFCGFELEDEVIDYGWRYSRKFWGSGYGSEAGLAVLKMGLEQFDLKPIESKSYLDNVGSVVIMKKMGMSFLRESMENGKPVVHYGFPDEE